MAETNRSAKAIRLRSIEQLIRLVIGDDTSREGLRDTPSRVLKAWEVWGAGYRERPEDFLTVFEDGAENYDQLIVVSDIPIYSHCEHHLTPFFGTCTIAYLPDGRIVGLSKLVRVAQLFARRLQVQERLTQQIADAIERHLRPRAVGVMLACRHLCMESRGVQAVGTVTRTQALRGALLTDADLRAEFAALESPRTL
jgi:GTP cyclohydrolase I